jgi:prepilin peptidase CpaA
MHMSMPLAAALVAVMALGAWIDVRTRRLPNKLTLTAVVLALALRGLLGGAALLDGVYGLALAFALLLPLFALGGVGGGDAKLMMAAGAFLGPHGFLVALLATALVGGVMSAAYAMRRGVILPALYSTGSLLRYVVTAGRSGERTTLEMPHVLRVPYGVAIAAGSMFALWFRAFPLG